MERIRDFHDYAPYKFTFSLHYIYIKLHYITLHIRTCESEISVRIEYRIE